MTKTSMVVAGIDTAKDKLDVAIHGQSTHWRVENNLKGWGQLRSELAKAEVGRVGIARQRGGSYERGVVRHLREAGFTVLVLQPIQVNAFAKVQLRRAKNDPLDAVLIAACTAVHRKAPDRARSAPGRTLRIT